MSKGKLIVIVAPSGAGKSTLIKRMKKEFPVLKESVSFTTRKIREGEVHGQQYFYISREEFLDRRDAGEFIEWAEVHSNFYGTSKAFVESELNDGSSLLFDLDVQGVDSFKNYFGDKAKAIFIIPPSIDELEARLRKRGTETEEVIKMRVENARKEVLRKNDYDYCIVNDDFEKAYVALKKVVEEILEE